MTKKVKKYERAGVLVGAYLTAEMKRKITHILTRELPPRSISQWVTDSGTKLIESWEKKNGTITEEQLNSAGDELRKRLLEQLNGTDDPNLLKSLLKRVEKGRFIYKKKDAE